MNHKQQNDIFNYIKYVKFMRLFKDIVKDENLSSKLPYYWICFDSGIKNINDVFSLLMWQFINEGYKQEWKQIQ